MVCPEDKHASHLLIIARVHSENTSRQLVERRSAGRADVLPYLLSRFAGEVDPWTLPQYMPEYCGGFHGGM